MIFFALISLFGEVFWWLASIVGVALLAVASYALLRPLCRRGPMVWLGRFLAWLRN